MDIYTFDSKCDGLQLEIAVTVPEGEPRGIVQISHGMAEHKERYTDFMQYFSAYDYICVVHDHRGHGASVRASEDLGYFYTEDACCIVEDLYQVTCFVKEKYPGLRLFLFSHSMGTLVSRNYLKKYDAAIDKLILCGPPTENPLALAGILMAKLSILLKGDRYRSSFLQKLTFGSYNRGLSQENAWICTDSQTVSAYNDSALCGYVFTNNGFLNLYRLMRNAFCKQGWELQNPDLPIFIIAGGDDPVIQSREKFYRLEAFLRQRGYREIESRLYEGKRHELLNEVGKMKIYEDIRAFIERGSKDESKQC